MKRTIALIIGLAIAGSAYAACRTSTLMTSSGTVVCTTCCSGGNCTTQCY